MFAHSRGRTDRRRGQPAPHDPHATNAPRAAVRQTPPACAAAQQTLGPPAAPDRVFSQDPARVWHALSAARSPGRICCVYSPLGVTARSLWAMHPRACVRKYATRPLVATKAGSPAAPAVVYLNLPPQRAGRMPLIVLLKTIPWAHTFHSIETDVLMGEAALACCRCQCFSSLDPMCVVVCAVGPCG